jgi:hypothetical protein
MDQQRQTNNKTPLQGQDDAIVNQRRPIPAITHFAILTAFILPMTLLPFLVIRRQVSLLRRKLEEMGTITATLQQDLATSLSETAIRRNEHRRVRALLHEMKQEVDELRLQGEQRASTHVAADEAVRSDLRKLLEETQQMRHVLIS